MKNRKSMLLNTLWILIVGFIYCFLAGGCSSNPAPDFEQLKADLEKRLQENKGDMTKGSTDIYTIVSLAIVNRADKGEKGRVMDFEGEVECLTGFYMSEDGKHSISKPSWKAKRHVTKGSRFSFSGSVEYTSGVGGWKLTEFYTKMKKKYAPPIS